MQSLYPRQFCTWILQSCFGCQLFDAELPRVQKWLTLRRLLHPRQLCIEELAPKALLQNSGAKLPWVQSCFGCQLFDAELPRVQKSSSVSHPRHPRQFCTWILQSCFGCHFLNELPSMQICQSKSRLSVSHLDLDHAELNYFGCKIALFTKLPWVYFDKRVSLDVECQTPGKSVSEDRFGCKIALCAKLLRCNFYNRVTLDAELPWLLHTGSCFRSLIDLIPTLLVNEDLHKYPIFSFLLITTNSMLIPFYCSVEFLSLEQFQGERLLILSDLLF